MRFDVLDLLHSSIFHNEYMGARKEDMKGSWKREMKEGDFEEDLNILQHVAKINLFLEKKWKQKSNKALHWRQEDTIDTEDI